MNVDYDDALVAMSLALTLIVVSWTPRAQAIFHPAFRIAMGLSALLLVAGIALDLSGPSFGWDFGRFHDDLRISIVIVLWVSLVANVVAVALRRTPT